jgi:hypothetical protein
VQNFKKSKSRGFVPDFAHRVYLIVACDSQNLRITLLYGIVKLGLGFHLLKRSNLRSVRPCHGSRQSSGRAMAQHSCQAVPWLKAVVRPCHGSRQSSGRAMAQHICQAVPGLMTVRPCHGSGELSRRAMAQESKSSSRAMAQAPSHHPLTTVDRV